MASHFASAEGSPFPDFEKELTNLINKHSVDSYCNMHDFILSEYLVKNVLSLYDANVRKKAITRND